VRQDELEFFIKGNVSLEPAERAKPFAWLPDECWKHMSLLSEQFTEKFGTLLDDFAEHEYKWKRWYDADAPESMKYPKQYKKLSGFHRLMLLRCFRIDRVYRAITDYVSGIMGNRYTTLLDIIIIIIIIHEFHGDTSLKQNFRAAVNVTY